MDETSVRQLVELGLTQYEAQCYLALIGRSGATPSEAARIGRVPRPRAYDVLASLAERGFVASVPGSSTLRYAAKPPDQVLDALLDVRKQDLARMSEQSARLADDLRPRFLQGQDRGEPLDYVEVVRDARNAVQRVNRLWSEAHDEVLAVVCPPYLAPPASGEPIPESSIGTRALYERSILDEPGLADAVRTYADLGEEIRFAQNLPMKMTIVDERAVAFNMPDPVEGGQSVTTLIVRHEALAVSLKITFETIWEQAQTFEEVMGLTAPAAT